MNVYMISSVALALAALGCSSVAPPAKEANQTEAAIRAADEMGANSVPTASLHLKLARDQLRDAKALMADGENESARTILARARMDAELAVAMAHSSDARIEAQAMAKKVTTLQQEAQ